MASRAHQNSTRPMALSTDLSLVYLEADLSEIIVRPARTDLSGNLKLSCQDAKSRTAGQTSVLAGQMLDSTHFEI